jgi:hypothetical protein
VAALRPSWIFGKASGDQAGKNGAHAREDPAAVVPVGDIPGDEEQCGDRQKLGESDIAER